jgi:hypothetical protein
MTHRSGVPQQAHQNGGRGHLVPAARSELQRFNRAITLPFAMPRPLSGKRLQLIERTQNFPAATFGPATP